jgi:3'-phosphoadenosine 5'-phosphosulfate sulfotransferase (PAPS reductase)/FAD synthetase
MEPRAAKAERPEVEKAAQLAAEDPGLARGAAGSALRPEDLIHAQLSTFKLRVERSLDAIKRAVDVGPIGISFSGGKDSTCALHLVRMVVENAPAALFDSGAEIAGTHEMAAHVGAQTIHPRLTMLDMARYCGWWGCADPVDTDSEFDAKRMLLEEPSETFVVRNRLRVIAHGVRASESHGRSMHVASRGELYRGRDGTWVCMPLARWSLEDVWAYIASRELRYHRAYDALSAAGIPRENQRVSGALGERGSGWGRHAALRIVDPVGWHRLVTEFPRIGLNS